MGGIVSVVIGGITTVAMVFVLLKYSGAVGTVSSGATKSYADVAKTFQGG